MITCSFPSSNLIRGTLDPVKSPGPAPALPPLSVVGANEPNCSLHPSNYLSPPRARCTPHSSLTSRRLSQVSPNQSSVSPLSANQGRASPGEPRPAWPGWGWSSGQSPVVARPSSGTQTAHQAQQETSIPSPQASSATTDRECEAVEITRRDAQGWDHSIIAAAAKNGYTDFLTQKDNVSFEQE